jgi:D-alanyl-lipoteichoic acid acyltransferase DltB (MBOAT superfamily)
MYKPLGGRASRLWSVWLIFVFVSLWHDCEAKLLAWGLLNSLFFVIEALARHAAQSAIITRSVPSSLLKFVCVAGSATYIMVLIGVNLVGYTGAAGQKELSSLVDKIYSWDGLYVISVCYYFLFIAVLLMTALKEMKLS